jgi:hypothetical protein
MALLIEKMVERVEFPKVPGRVVLIDGDILAYHCGFDNEQPLEEAFDVAKNEIQSIMNFCRAEDYKIALTGTYKGGRYEIATVKPYQQHRGKSKKPINVQPLKELFAKELGGVFTDEEADDLLTQWQNEAGCNDSTIIWSTDKDLKICDGWHYTPKGLEEVHGYGYCYYEKSKVKGFGKSFFFHQLLMGDTADNIPGLPKLFGKQCGAKRTFDYLSEAKTELEALDLCINAYYDFYEDDWLEMMLEQGRLLWMRRKPYEDVLEYFKELVNDTEGYEEIRLQPLWKPTH